jgi:hypothetical protein
MHHVGAHAAIRAGDELLDLGQMGIDRSCPVVAGHHRFVGARNATYRATVWWSHPTSSTAARQLPVRS